MLTMNICNNDDCMATFVNFSNTRSISAEKKTGKAGLLMLQDRNTIAKFDDIII